MASAKLPSRADILLVDFEAWTDTGELFDTTRPKVAEKEGWEGAEKLTPMPVLLGGHRVVAGFEEALATAKVGDEGEVKVPPEKAFGKVDPNLARYMPVKDFEKREIEPEVGGQVEVGGRRGTIVQVTASRVRVDFNHPLAGRTLTYKYRVVDKVEKVDERVKALLGIDYSVTRTPEFSVTVTGKTARVGVPDSAAWDTRWFLAKHRLFHDLFEQTDVDSVELVETLTRVAHDEHGHGHAPDADGGNAESAETDDGLTEEERL